MAYKFTYNELTFCEDVEQYASRYYQKYERFYHTLYSGADLVEKAKLHAIFHFTLNLANQSKKERGCFIKDIQRQLDSLEKDGIPGNYDHFTSILKEMRDKNIQVVLNHEAKGKPRYKTRKFHPLLLDHAETIWAKKLCTYKQVLEKTNKKAKELGLNSVTIHMIKKHFCKKSVQARLRPIRNGEEWYSKNIAKQQHFIKPEYAGQLLEIDGSRFQIPFNNKVKKDIDFISVFAILDAATAKTVGYSHGKYESSKVVVNAFKRFFNQYDFLPHAIIRDRSSSYKKDFEFIETLTSKRGVEWIHTSNPQGKPNIENFFKTFAKSICSSHENYIGLGITATHIDSRYSRSKLKKKIGNRHLLPTYEEVVLLIDELMSEYNNTKFDYVESSNTKFERLFNKDQVLDLIAADKVAMTDVFRSKYVSNQEIHIKKDNISYFYQFPGEIGESLEKVNVAYDTNNLEKIFIYNEDLEYQISLPVMEKIPQLSKMRSSSQQEKYIKELVARKNRFKKLNEDVLEKEKRVAKASENRLSFQVLRIHTNKEEEIETQNEYTRSLLRDEFEFKNEEITIKMPPNSVEVVIDKSLFKTTVS